MLKSAFVIGSFLMGSFLFLYSQAQACGQSPNSMSTTENPRGETPPIDVSIDAQTQPKVEQALKKSVDRYEKAVILLTQSLLQADEFSDFGSLEARRKKAHDAYLEAKLDLRDLGVDLRQHPGVLKFKRLHEGLRKLRIELSKEEVQSELAKLQESQAERNRRELFGEASSTGTRSASRTPRTNRELLDQGLKTSKETTAQLKDSLTLIYHSTEIADEALKVLNQDQETLERIQERTDQIDSELVLARKNITRLLKSLYTDRAIQAFTLGVVGLSVMAILGYADPGLIGL